MVTFGTFTLMYDLDKGSTGETADYAFIYNDEIICPSEVRMRSRGKHDPGSGKYWCIHARLPHSGFDQGGKFFPTSTSIRGFTRAGAYYVTSVGGSHFHEVTAWQNRSTKKWFAYGGEGYVTYHERSPGNWRSRYMVIHYTTLRQDSPCETAEQAADTATPKGESQWTSSCNTILNGNVREPQIIDTGMADAIDLGLLPNLGFHLSEAYTNAFSSLPSLHMNNIANIIDAAKTGYDLVKGRLDSLGSLSSAWLGYRYQYTTTKSDIEELSKYMDRLSRLSGVSNITGHGGSYLHNEGVDYTIRASITVSLSEVSSLGSWAERYGLALDAYNIWDMIPYSFIVDWFLPIGDALETVGSFNDAVSLHPSEAWFSVTRTFENSAGSIQTDYYRFPAASWGALPLPVSAVGGLSNNKFTWIRRVGDLVALRR